MVASAATSSEVVSAHRKSEGVDDSPMHSVDECVKEEDSQPRSDARRVLRVVQLVSDVCHTEDHASGEGWVGVANNGRWSNCSPPRRWREIGIETEQPRR